MTDKAICTLCAKKESSGFYTGCMIRDGECTDSGWQCDGNGNLTRPARGGQSMDEAAADNFGLTIDDLDDDDDAMPPAHQNTEAG